MSWAFSFLSHSCFPVGENFLREREKGKGLENAREFYIDEIINVNISAWRIGDSEQFFEFFFCVFLKTFIQTNFLAAFKLRETNNFLQKSFKIYKLKNVWIFPWTDKILHKFQKLQTHASVQRKIEWESESSPKCVIVLVKVYERNLFLSLFQVT